jgi:hypothetical protein
MAPTRQYQLRARAQLSLNAIKTHFKRLRVSLLLLYSVFVISGCGLVQNASEPSRNCALETDQTKVLPCTLKLALDRINSIETDLTYWSNWHTLALLASIVFGAVATVVIGLQGDHNVHWTRPVGLVATTFGAAVTTLLTTFHVQDNIDKLIDIRSKLKILTNTLEHDVKDKSAKEIDEFIFTYSIEFGNLIDEKDKLKGSAGRLNILGTSERESKVSTDRATKK